MTRLQAAYDEAVSLPYRREPGQSPHATAGELRDAMREAVDIRCRVTWTDPLGRHQCGLVAGHEGGHEKGRDS